MKKLAPNVLLLLVLSATTTESLAQERPYMEGPVIEVTFVRTKPGMFNQYMQHLQSSYKQVMEAQKEAGIILDYRILAAPPANPDDHDLILTVTYPNMAAFDGLEERVDPIAASVTNMSREQASQAYADRSEMREVLGSRIYRVLELR